MRVRLIFIAIFIFGIFAFSGCKNVSVSEMKSGIQKSIQKDLDDDADLMKYKMKVTSVYLIKKNSNSYEGFATVAIRGKEEKLSIEVTTEGEDYMYQSKPLAFGFLMKYD